MINYSFSTVLMTILFCNVIVFILYMIFQSKKILPEFGLKLTGFFLCLVILRLLLPIEIPALSHNIYFPSGLSRMIALFRQPRFRNSTISWWNLIEIVWGFGILFCGIRYGILSYHLNRLIKQASLIPDENSLLFETFQRIRTENPKAQGIFLRTFPPAKIPLVYGLFKPCILFPNSLDLTEEELYYILLHEIQHILHRDLWIKFGIQILVIIYWWNPFCWLLKKQLDVYVEMRVDHSLTPTPTQKTAYLSCLLKIARQDTGNLTSIYTATIPFCKTNISVLQQRFNMIINEKQTRFQNIIQKVIESFLLLVFICSFLFIFEAFTTPEEVDELMTISEETAFFIDNQNGTYDFYINNEYIETTDSLEYYSPDIKIYSSLKEVFHNEN